MARLCLHSSVLVVGATSTFMWEQKSARDAPQPASENKILVVQMKKRSSQLHVAAVLSACITIFYLIEKRFWQSINIAITVLRTVLKEKRVD